MVDPVVDRAGGGVSAREPGPGSMRRLWRPTCGVTQCLTSPTTGRRWLRGHQPRQGSRRRRRRQWWRDAGAVPVVRGRRGERVHGRQQRVGLAAPRAGHGQGTLRIRRRHRKHEARREGGPRKQPPSPVTLVAQLTLVVKNEKRHYRGIRQAARSLLVALCVSLATRGEEFDAQEVLLAAEYGLSRMRDLVQHQEPVLYDKGMWLGRDSPAHYVAAFNGPSDMATQLARFGYAALQASHRLVDSSHRSGRRRVHLPRVSTPLEEQCPLRGRPPCAASADLALYRTADGSCNNPAHPWWGAAFTPLRRLLPALYDDGLERVRRSASGRPLPSARTVSVAVHADRKKDLPTVTHMLMQWGQFLDHDLTASAQSRGFNGSVPKCCSTGGRNFLPDDLTHPDCLAIEVPPDDRFFRRHGVRCLEFVRSSAAPRPGCPLGPRDQINQVTSFLDASNVYGSSDREADELRLFRHGLLRHGRVTGRLPLLPPRSRADLCRPPADSRLHCFAAGDSRVNEQPGLIAMHALWLRQHNLQAARLRALNPHWGDDTLYQETRRLVAAIMQHVTYREFLPIVLGPDVVKMFGLELVKKGYYEEYHIKENPSAINAFATAAFRFGHSLVQPHLSRCDSNHNQMPANVSLHAELTVPSNMYNIGSVDHLLLGLCAQTSQKRDEYITEELTNHLFQTPSYPYGMDLAAINIQRGRDHGLPGYNAWRGPCGLESFTHWDQMQKVMSTETVEHLKRVYRIIDDVDLFPGGMAERPVYGGLVGPTFACIIAQQFSSLRKGDRFWYENGGFASSFTLAQLQQIRRVTMARVLCDNLDSISTIQPFVFLTADDYRNRLTSCKSSKIPELDLSPWAETSPDDFTDTSTEEHYAQELPSFPFNENFESSGHKQSEKLPTYRPHGHNNNKPTESNFENTGNYQYPSQSSPNKEHKPNYSHTYVLTVNISSHHKESYHTTEKPSSQNNIPDNFDHNHGSHHFQTPNKHDENTPHYSTTVNSLYQIHNHPTEKTTVGSHYHTTETPTNHNIPDNYDQNHGLHHFQKPNQNDKYTPNYSTTPNYLYQNHKHPTGTTTAAPNHFYEFENHEIDHNYSDTSYNKPIPHKNNSESYNHFYEPPQKVKPNYSSMNGYNKPNYNTQNHFYEPPSKIVIVPKFYSPVPEYSKFENASKSKYEENIYYPESIVPIQRNKTDNEQSYKLCNKSNSIKETTYNDMKNEYETVNESRIDNVQLNITHTLHNMIISEQTYPKLKSAFRMNDRTSWVFSFHEDTDIQLPEMPTPASDPDFVQELPKPMNVTSEEAEMEGWEQSS